MTIIQAAFLGVIQGLTEFLPVSSSAHLVIVQYLMGLKGPTLLVFDVVVHLGTLSAILVYFARELFPVPKIGWRFFALVAAATVPTAVIGFALKHRVEQFFITLGPVAVALLVNSFILLSTRWAARGQTRSMTRWVDAVWVGVIQGISVIPGISRSGSTTAAALWRGIKGEDAVRFSFYIAIPAILGAAVVVIPDGMQYFNKSDWLIFSTGFLTAFVSGYLAISIVFRIVLQGKFYYFAAYSFLLSAAAFLFSRWSA